MTFWPDYRASDNSRTKIGDRLAYQLPQAVRTKSGWELRQYGKAGLRRGIQYNTALRGKNLRVWWSFGRKVVVLRIGRNAHGLMCPVKRLAPGVWLSRG